MAFPRPPSLQQLCPPTPDIFKVNFNAAIFQSSNLAGLDVIVCDSSGAAIGALSVPISLDCSVAEPELEALVCLRAVQFALEIGLTRVVLKGDSAAVIDALWHGSGELTSYENVLDDIRVQVSVFQFFYFNLVSRLCNFIADALAKKASSVVGLQVGWETYLLTLLL